MFRNTWLTCLLVWLSASITSANPAGASGDIQTFNCLGTDWVCDCSKYPGEPKDAKDNADAQECCATECEDWAIVIIANGNGNGNGGGKTYVGLDASARNPFGVEIVLEFLLRGEWLGFELAGAFEEDDDEGGPRYFARAGLRFHFRPGERIDPRFSLFVAYVDFYDVRCDVAEGDLALLCADAMDQRIEIDDKVTWGASLGLDKWIGERSSWGINVAVRYLKTEGEALGVVLDRDLFAGTVGFMWRL